MKIHHFLWISLTLLLAGCSDDTDTMPSREVRYDLIGRGVNFCTSRAELFTTRTTYRHDGSFNEGDIMTIFRQYSEDYGHTFNASTEAYRVYYYVPRTAAGTDIVLGNDWKPKKGSKGSDAPGTTFTQTEADSLTWENGKTVRFRAWSRSNLAGAIDNKTRDRYYPDYCVAEWVTVTGPTTSIPLTLKHVGCRIGITAKAGNELARAEICTDVEDYRRRDNSTDRSHDEAAAEHGKSLAEAQAELDQVMAVYNRMCIPAGVSVETSLLSTMTQTLYNAMDDFSTIREKTADDGIVSFNTWSPEDIASQVQHPVFCANDGRLYMISIPYDMSTAATRGEALTLPPCTRFRVWLYDVNNGDAAGTTGEEATYHIFCLSDVMDKESGTDRQPLFPNGLELQPGVSYRFSVGYHYNQFTVTASDDFSWDDQDTEDGVRTDEANPIADTRSYQWWKTAIAEAIPQNIQESYNPQFHISTEEEFLEFIHLVNGTAVKTYVKNNPIVRMLDPTKTYDTDHPATPSDYKWYYAADVVDGKLKSGAEPLSRTLAESLGYVFYQHYYPADGDQAAYSEEDYLRTPYSFYDENLNRHFTVYLDADLDLRDQQTATIGRDADKPFQGNMEGYDETNQVIHTIRNINIDGGYLFGYCHDVALRNIQIETEHNFMLVRQSTARNAQSGSGAFIVGVSIKAPSSGNPIAGTLTGNSYVVGCYYEGHAGGALVGTADNLRMYGNMVAATGLTSTTGALLGAYADANNKFLAPQPPGQPLTWGRFMANYYDVTLSPGATAIGGIADTYRPQEYIRGRESWILKAKNDNMISGEVPFDNIPTEQMKRGYYGLAPWKAMNYAISMYNVPGGPITDVHNCKSHFVNGDTGYSHTYPRRVFGEPDSQYDHTGYKDNYESLNLLELFN